MVNVTIRNIPDEIMNIIKTLSQLEKRSINNEILTILEKGIQKEIKQYKDNDNYISPNTQIKLWTQLANQWEDSRSTKEIIDDIYNNRTLGRNINL